MARLVAKALVVLALAVAVSSQGQGGNNRVTTEFCENLVDQMSSCRRPSTVDSIRLDQFDGMWYEIGTNAQAAFAPFLQLGGQCVTANYSSPTRTLGVTTFGADHDFLKVIEDPQRAQVAVISDAARSVTLNILSVCRSIVGSFLSVQNFEIAASRLGSWSRDQDFDTAARNLRNQIASASERSRGMYDALAQIQLANNILNGGGLPGNVNVAAARATILAQTEDIKTLLTVFNQQRVIAHESAAELNEIAFNPFTKAAATSIMGLTGEVGDWFRAVQGIAASVRAIDFTINALGTDKFENLTDTFLNNTLEDPRTTAATADRILSAMALAEANPTQTRRAAARAAARASGPGRKLQFTPEALYRVPRVTASTDKGDVVSVEAFARQSFFQAGRLQLSYSPLVFEDFLVVRVWGPPAQGYTAALVYTCMTNTGTGGVPQSGLVLLSRTPVVAPAVVAQALVTANTIGMQLGGDNPFVTVAQDSAFCGWQ